MIRHFACFFMICFAFANAGCGSSRTSSLDLDEAKLMKPTINNVKSTLTETARLADKTWKSRVEEKSLLLAIRLYSKAALLPSPNLTSGQRRTELIHIYTRLSRAYYLLADSHLYLRLDKKVRDKKMMKTFEQGITAAEKALALGAPAFTKRVAKDRSVWKKEVNKVPEAAYPSLYWYGANLGKWAMLEGITTIMARQDDMRATMKVIELKRPTFFHGAAYRYFGVYYTKVPISGGDPTQSTAYFKKSIELSPNCFATRVLYAQHLATLTQDEKLFERQLKQVIDTPSDMVESLAPENALEQKKARKLLSQMKSLFYELDR